MEQAAGARTLISNDAHANGRGVRPDCAVGALPIELRPLVPNIACSRHKPQLAAVGRRSIKS